MFETGIFQDIQRAWILDQKHPHRGREQKPVPAIDAIKTLVETAFLASLKREEERAITFAVGLLPKWETTDDVLKQTLRFHQNIPFTVASIAKLATAFDPEATALIVGPARPQSNDYTIWGAYYYGPQERNFEDIPVEIGDFNKGRPDIFIVTAGTAGSLALSRGLMQIGRFVDGKFIPAVPSPFNSRAMGNHLAACLKHNAGYQKYGQTYWQIFRDSLGYLIAEASMRGHGGTLLIIPEHLRARYAGEYIRRLSFENSLRIDELMTEQLALNPSIPARFLVEIALNNFISDRLKVIAQLASIDGAVLLTDQFEVVSFGSTLKARPWKGDVVIGPDGYGGGGQPVKTTEFGTRHSSTINFVGACPGTVGFVISQDGPIRGLTRKNPKTILCWPDCSVSMDARIN